MSGGGRRAEPGAETGARVSSRGGEAWLAEQKQHGVKVMFFTTEHSRISSLKSELGTFKNFQVLTSKELNNKFTLARAEL